MQQRVGLARAFATVKKTIVFASHDLDETLKLGNHIAIMEGSRVVQFRPPEEIILEPAKCLCPREPT
jgi:ABC-type proline/glycine betaine transport system ATPase subunit